MKKGQLILLPTPLSEEGVPAPEVVELLKKALENPKDYLILCEDLKPARRRMTQWGIGREIFDQLTPYNEHTRADLCEKVIGQLKLGITVLLFSDGGLPAFCDPGQELVKRCHDENLKVTSVGFFNSPILALALSGFAHNHFYFAGFPPQNTESRHTWWNEVLLKKETIVIMDTPYKLKKIVQETVSRIDASSYKNRTLFLAMELGGVDEELLRFTPQSFKKSKIDEGLSKKNFILIVGPENS